MRARYVEYIIQDAADIVYCLNIAIQFELHQVCGVDKSPQRWGFLYTQLIFLIVNMLEISYVCIQLNFQNVENDIELLIFINHHAGPGQSSDFSEYNRICGIMKNKYNWCL